MERKNHSVKYLRRRKFLMVLPVLTLPFITLMFWALGGGKGNSALAHSQTMQGLNLKLPDAKFKNERGLNKLSFYQQAALDSARTKAAEKLDPYWEKASDNADDSMISPGDRNKSLYSDNRMEANKMRVYNKLEELKRTLATSQELSNYNEPVNHPNLLQSYSSSNDVDRLQSMMQKMKQDKSEDPEITQLNSMLDKIIAIQNPDRIDSINNSSSEKTLSVKTRKQEADISLLKSDNNRKNSDTTITTNSNNAFYCETNDNYNNSDSNGNSIEADVPETQTIVAGATVKLTLSNDVKINDMLLPSGTFVYGTASVSNERLKIEISSIRYKKSILPVSLNVYDMDGQEGIYIPGSINRTVAKESANNAIGGLNSTAIDPSIEAQAASAGIEAAKSLFSRKIKLVKITVKAGYKVLLKNNSDK